MRDRRVGATAPARLGAVALVVAGGIGACAATDGPPSALRGAAVRPNVVLVTTDDQREDELGPMRAVRARLAARGVRFTNAFSTFPLCCPSRATLLTGQYAHNHGVLSNEFEEGGGYRAFDDRGSLPVALRAAGYRTAMFGKYLNEYEGPEVPRGWSQWSGLIGRSTLFGYRLNVNGRSRRFGSRPRDYQTDVVARRSAGFVNRAAGDDPFFLWASFFAPHRESLPGVERWNPRPAPRHRGRYRRAALPRPAGFDERNVADKPGFVRRASRLSRKRVRDLRRRQRSRQATLLAVDDAVARLLDRLERAGELDKTLFIFTSDNGFLMGEHRLEGKRHLYDEAARVPLVVSGPGLPEGLIYSGVVGNIDVAPTIFDVTGVAPMRALDGVSLVPLANDPVTSAERDLLLENDTAKAIRTRRWMYAEHRRAGGVERELYDLARDPGQLRSLHADPAYAAARDDLATRLSELRDCVEDDCR